MQDSEKSGTEEIGTEEIGTEARLVAGRALIDIPALGLKCGEYDVVAESDLTCLIEAGAFDPNAKEIAEE